MDCVSRLRLHRAVSRMGKICLDFITTIAISRMYSKNKHLSLYNIFMYLLYVGCNSEADYQFRYLFQNVAINDTASQYIKLIKDSLVG